MVDGGNGGMMDPLLQLLDAFLCGGRDEHDPGRGAGLVTMAAVASGEVAIH